MANLGEVELERVIGGERHKKTTGKEFSERISVVVEEERVVAEWRHGNTDLGQVIEVLEYRHLENIIGKI